MFLFKNKKQTPLRTRWKLALQEKQTNQNIVGVFWSVAVGVNTGMCVEQEAD